MKRFLSLMLALMFVFVIGASAVYADEPAATTEAATEAAPEATADAATDAAAAAAPQLPADFDESSIEQFIVFDFTEKTGENKDKIAVGVYMTATEGTLTYYSQMSAMYGQTLTEGTYEGKKALILSEMMVTQEEFLESSGMGRIYKDGFFCDKEYYIYVGGSMLDSGLEEGQKASTFVLKFDGKTESFDIIVGQENTYMIENYYINWVSVLIVVMCIVVVLLAVVIIIIAVKRKKKVNTEANDKKEKFVSEDEVFEELVAEAGVEAEETEETEIEETDDESEEK